MNLQILEQNGVDVREGMARCLNDPGFYEVVLNLFLQDDCFARARKARERGSRAELFQCVHEMKGTSGNAALTPLFKEVCPLVELLRDGGGSEEEIAAMFGRVETQYARMRGVIESALSL